MQLGVTHGCSPCAKNSVRGSTQNPAQGSLSPRIIPRATTLGSFSPVYISHIYEPLVPFFLSFTNHTPTRPPSEGGVVLLSADRTSGLHHLRRPIFAPSPTTTIYSNPTAVLHCALGGGGIPTLVNNRAEARVLTASAHQNFPNKFAIWGVGVDDGVVRRSLPQASGCGVLACNSLPSRRLSARNIAGDHMSSDETMTAADLVLRGEITSLKGAFSYFDVDGNGKISSEESGTGVTPAPILAIYSSERACRAHLSSQSAVRFVRRLLRILLRGESHFSLEEASSLVEEFDEDGDGRSDF